MNQASSTPFNFDQEINRHHTQSEKWDKYSGKDILPLWVADSDFQSPPEVIEALQQRVAHGIFGYSHSSENLTQLIVDRMQNLYQWTIKPEWIVYLPGLVCGLNIAVRSFSQSHHRVICPTPIYPPFMSSIQNAQRQCLNIQMKLSAEQRWEIDFEELKEYLQGDEGLFMLCNPHNPGGTVFRRNELLQLEALATANNWLVCSDEIHCDLILNQKIKHIPYASISKAAEQHSVTLIAPSKTFNIAGLGASIAIIPNTTLRQQFDTIRQGIVSGVNVLAYTAAEAAYQYGQPWHDAQLNYLRANFAYLIEKINQIPGLTMYPMDGTYLAWIDASKLPVTNPHQFFEDAGVGLSAGNDYGNPHFLRLNFACTMKTLKEAVKRMEIAVMKLN